MVSLAQIRASNAKLATTLPPGLVAVFAGATSGIGEASLKQFAENTCRPRIYFLGRSEESGTRIRAELQRLNAGGEYHYISVDISLLRSVDDVCREIKEKESVINLLFLSTDTDEGLNYPVAVSYYARFRLLVNLLPLLQNATDLRRVVTVFTATKEGNIDTNDFQARHIPMMAQRGHLSSLTTLSLEAVAKSAPTVSFVHCFPGFVKTNYGRDVPGVGAAIFRGVLWVLFLFMGPFLVTPLGEVGERQLFLATSARFPGRGESGTVLGIPLSKDVAVARGTDGKSGSGVYSIDSDAESAPPKVEQRLENLRKDGIAQKVWAQVQEQFVRITGNVSI
ncbi:hypothetical protein JX265_012768 [Neoarthrinium moseri]|uniref:Uncharacterized protein n=1 Tax=Neoarthrinium moseri TaxID=1658444 RepID=A0A9P9W9N0_9PEZI|nr:hypothetical protein JX265_012768 [Neoarthrinium moseri]